LAELLENGKVTLVYGAKDEEHNDAVVLKEYLEKKKYENMFYEDTFKLSPLSPFRLDLTVWALRRRQKIT
jgi:hypothetical protein